MGLLTSAALSAQPLLKELAIQRDLWRLRGTFWKFFPRWLLPGLVLLLSTGFLFLAYQGSLWGTFAVFPALLYLARCFEETWPEASKQHAQRLLRRARRAQQAGRLNRAFRLARVAESVVRTQSAKLHDQALEQQAQVLLLQGQGAAALRELSRSSPYQTPSSALRVRAMLQTGESSLALALARRMFTQAPTPETARLVAMALLQLQRTEEARHFLSLAGERAESLPAAMPALRPCPPTPRPWEEQLPLKFWVSWTLATTGGLLLGLLVDLPWLYVSQETASRLYSTPLLLALSAAQGGVLGLAQAWVLRRVMPEPGLWPLFTALGYALGTAALGLLIEAGGFPDSLGLVAVIYIRGLKSLMALCFQAILLVRWMLRSAVWLLAVIATALAAELVAQGLAGVVWHPSVPFAWDLLPSTAWEWVAQILLGTLCRGALLGIVGGALLHQEVARHPERYEPPELRPLTANYPQVSARTRPRAISREGIPQRLPVAAMNGKLFCPGADAFFRLPEAQFHAISPVFSFSGFVIVPKQGEATVWSGEASAQVGVLVRVYRYEHLGPDEGYRIRVRMLARVRLKGLVHSEYGPLAQLEPVEDLPCKHPQAQLDRLRYCLNNYIRSTPDLELEEALPLRDPVFLADFIATHLELSPEERRALLEDPCPDSRVERVCEWLNRALLEPPRPPEGLKGFVDRIWFEQAWGE